MKRKAGILSAMLLVGLLAAAQKVTTDFDHSYNFSQVKTFAVEIGTSWGNPLAEQHAKNAVAGQLAAKGWRETDAHSADVLVVIHGATQTKRSFDTFYSGGGWNGWGWGGPGLATTTVNDVRVGAGVVDIFDQRTRKLVFRGTAQDEVSEKPEKNRRKIEKATEKMFKNFPPK